MTHRFVPIRCLWARWAAAAVLLALGGPALGWQGAADPAQMVADCETLAAARAAQAGIPPGLMPAIARVEAGRGDGRGGRRAWPWTLNHSGKGMYFETREAALDYLYRAIAEGATNIDIGCMQVNYHWHGDHFRSLEEMIDPLRNVDYAARFLIDLHQRLGSWEAATRHYHSADPARGARYQGLVTQAQTIMARAGPGGSVPDWSALAGHAPVSGWEGSYAAVNDLDVPRVLDLAPAAPRRTGPAFRQPLGTVPRYAGPLVPLSGADRHVAASLAGPGLARHSDPHDPDGAWQGMHADAPEGLGPDPWATGLLDPGPLAGLDDAAGRPSDPDIWAADPPNAEPLRTAALVPGFGPQADPAFLRADPRQNGAVFMDWRHPSPAEAALPDALGAEMPWIPPEQWEAAATPGPQEP
ncbi:hypothetical protein ACFQXB_05410 [Plastorhodobacter daqingensis]|uniref:Transglycosylase SLT domain-containing protein n=1 Tax=Plastorhodobacter daqingensis TaxID=1387281 RepID=A0ABW2UJ66_9RHOB